MAPKVIKKQYPEGLPETHVEKASKSDENLSFWVPKTIDFHQNPTSKNHQTNENRFFSKVVAVKSERSYAFKMMLEDVLAEIEVIGARSVDFTKIQLLTFFKCIL